jgi:hypothetical protein
MNNGYQDLWAITNSLRESGALDLIMEDLKKMKEKGEQHGQ